MGRHDSYDWDLGFLVLTGDRLRFVGEQARFVLRRDQILRISLGEGAKGWWSVPRVYITWRDETHGTDETFNIRPGGASTMTGAARQSRALAVRLQAWYAERTGDTATAFREDEPVGPMFGNVASTLPRESFTLSSFLRVVQPAFVLALVIAAALNLPFKPDHGGDAWYVAIGAVLALSSLWWPLLRSPSRISHTEGGDNRG